MFHDPFSHLHSSAYLISHASNFFKLYTNTPNHLDMLLNLLLCTLLQHFVIFQSLLVLSTHPLTYFLIVYKCLLSTLALFHFGFVTNFIQLVSSQLVDQFSQTKLHWEAPNEGYLHICGMYKSDNK